MIITIGLWLVVVILTYMSGVYFYIGIGKDVDKFDRVTSFVFSICLTCGAVLAVKEALA